jgi:hypothetical protein
MKTKPTQLKILNDEEIELRRIPLEDAEITLSKKSNWICTYCEKRYQTEYAFMRHNCEIKKRHDEMNSPIGESAYSYYTIWMKLKKFSTPPKTAFIESKYYRSFIKFSKLVISANIGRPETYIQLMINAQLLPSLWDCAGAYTLYTQYIDNLQDPIMQVADSISCLMDICEKENVQLNDIFNYIGANKTINLVHQRRLSPWFLFCSPKFGEMLHSLDQGQLKAFNNVVNSAYWGPKFQDNKHLVDQIKELIKEVGL